MFIVDSLTNLGPLDWRPASSFQRRVRSTVRQSIVESTYRRANRSGNSHN